MNAQPDPPDALEQLRQFVDPYDKELESRACFEALMRRILVLSNHAWERRIDEAAVKRWLGNFDGRSGRSVEVEQLHALYLLSQFLYFGVREIRVLLQSLYRDLFLIPLIADIRKKNNDTRDELKIRFEIKKELESTRFLGVGNPSESGVHLLYYFRQENRLSKSQFMDTADIFDRKNGSNIIADPAIRRYIFLDDVCGSGETAVKYSKKFLNEIRNQDKDVSLFYHCIFATSDGLKEVRTKTVFGDDAKAVFELDDSYKSISPGSRYFKIRPPQVDEATLTAIALHYGELVAPSNARGFGGGELLLGFSHNIPDNTLPIIWRDPENGSPVSWTAALRRYMKV